MPRLSPSGYCWRRRMDRTLLVRVSTLAAVAVGNILVGPFPVIIFSLELAMVLIAIGIALVKAAGVAGRYLDAGTGNSARYASTACALIVTDRGPWRSKAVIDVAGLGPLFLR